MHIPLFLGCKIPPSDGLGIDTIPMLLRAMSPQILAVDEITRESDCGCLLDCAGCGCSLLATAHGESLSDLHHRPAYRRLLEANLFDRVVFIGRQGGRRTYRMERLEGCL